MIKLPGTAQPAESSSLAVPTQMYTDYRTSQATQRMSYTLSVVRLYKKNWHVASSPNRDVH